MRRTSEYSTLTPSRLRPWNIVSRPSMSCSGFAFCLTRRRERTGHSGRRTPAIENVEQLGSACLEVHTRTVFASPSRVTCTDDRPADRIDRARGPAPRGPANRRRLRVGPPRRRTHRAPEGAAQRARTDVQRVRHRRDDLDLERRWPRLCGHDRPQRGWPRRGRRSGPLLGRRHRRRDGTTAAPDQPRRRAPTSRRSRSRGTRCR